MKKIKIPPNFEDTPKSFENFQRLAKQLMSVSKNTLGQKPTQNGRLKKQHKQKPKT